MSVPRKITVLLGRRDAIRQWLDDQAPFAGADQKHLEADTPERAYWHHGYQSALTDVLNLLAQKSRSEDKSSETRRGGRGGPGYLAGGNRGRARTPSRKPRAKRGSSRT